MLSKCANPICSARFRYLHEGRHYLVKSASGFDGRKQVSTSSSNYGSPEYAWLCSACSFCMTIYIDEENETIAVVETRTVNLTSNTVRFG
jgi:hypothetical protein